MIDFMATEEHFVDHLAPIWMALPPEKRGTFWANSGPALARAERKGLGPTPVVARRHDNPVVVASYGDVKKARYYRSPRIALLQHGAGQSYGGNPGTARHGSYSGGMDHHDVSLFLCPNANSASRWQEAYPDVTVEQTGSPKVEHLPLRQRPDGTKATIAISSHFQCNIVPETRPAFGHFRPYLADLRKDYNVIGHAHPRARRWLEPWYRRYGIPFVPDFEDVCRQADLYICDNSSTIFEFAATGRPVVLLNAPWYRKHIHHGGRFWEWSTVGVQVDDPDRLAEAVSCSLVDPTGLREERARVISQVFSTIKGSTALAVRAVEEWAK